MLYNTATCEGYSRAFQYLCQLVGINCICIGGEANNGEHMWNMVEVDGNWYHIDLTWDDSMYMPLHTYNYFLISDDKINKDHKVVNSFEIPSAPKSYEK